MRDILSIGESKYIEFKREYTKTLLKTICAFANYHDGQIFIGVCDSGKILGVDNIESIRLSIENAVNDNIVPKPYYEIIKESVDSKTIIIIKVYKGNYTPYTISNKAYKRIDTSTVQVDKYGFEDLILQGRNLSFDTLSFKGGELSFNVLEQRLREELRIGVLSKDLLKTLKLISNNEYTNGAALLSDNNPLQNTTIAMIRYADNSVLNIKDKLVVSNISIISQFDKSMDFYNKHINTGEIIEGAYRKTIEEIPKVAFRESIANAIVHRDYSRAGDIKIEIFDNRVEIISPGGLPIGISEEEYFEGKISIPRNYVVADIFLRIKIIEKLATGIRRIKEYYKEYDVYPVFEVSENSIKVVLPKVNGNYVSGVRENNLNLYKNYLNEHEHKLVKYLLEGHQNFNRKIAEELLQLKKTQTVEVINSLLEKEFIIKIGRGRNIKYVLKQR